jgi:hypothetical protein
MMAPLGAKQANGEAVPHIAARARRADCSRLGCFAVGSGQITSPRTRLEGIMPSLTPSSPLPMRSAKTPIRPSR